MPPIRKYLRIESVKDKIFDTALILGTLLGSVIYGLSLSSYTHDGFKFTFITDGFIVILLTVLSVFRKRINLKIKSLVILAFLFVLFFEDTLLLGVFSANKVLLVLIPFAALMTLSIRETVIISVFVYACFAVLAWLHLSGVLKAPPQDKIYLSAWMINIIFIAVVSATVAIIHVGFNRAFTEVISDLEESNLVISAKERNYREIFNFSTDAIFIHDLDGRIIDVNERMLMMYGYEPGDIPKLSIENLSSGDPGFSSKEAMEFFGMALEKGPQVFDWQARKKNRVKFWVEVSLKKAVISDNEVVLAIVRDINDKKEAEIQLNHYRNRLEKLVGLRTEELKIANEELKKRNAELTQKSITINNQNVEIIKAMKNLQETQFQLIQTEKFASIGVLTAGVGHQLNNPLNYIQGGLKIIEDQAKELIPNPTEELKIGMNAVKVGVERAASIVSSLNQLNRRDDTMTEECNLRKIIDDCLLLIQNLTLERIEIKNKIDAGGFIVTGNNNKLYQVFLNLLLNAVESIKSLVTIEITSQSAGSNVSVSISDSGAGIRKENIGLITEPFYTTKEPGKGTGLGLYITLNLIKEHKGELTFTSSPGEGTTATVTLPLSGRG